MAAAHLEIRRPDGTEVVSLAGARLTLGRSPENAVSFPSDSAVSRAHAILEAASDGWVIRDVGSSNGTFVNGARIDGGRTLREGDEVELGAVHMVFRADEHATGESPPAWSPSPSAGGYLDVGEEWHAPSAPAASSPAPRAAPSPAASASPPTPGSPASTAHDDLVRRGRATVRGVARGINIRRVSEQERDTLTFRVDRYDTSGNRLSAVGVEYRDYHGGLVGEGEEVEVTGKWVRGTLRADRVTNLSTAAEVHGGGKLRMIVAVIGVLAVLGFIAWIIISAATTPAVENPFE